jgi:hypothetical protein
MNIMSVHSDPDRKEIKFLSRVGWVFFTDLVFALIAIFPIIIDID